MIYRCLDLLITEYGIGKKFTERFSRLGHAFTIAKCGFSKAKLGISLFPSHVHSSHVNTMVLHLPQVKIRCLCHSNIHGIPGCLPLPIVLPVAQGTGLITSVCWFLSGIRLKKAVWMFAEKCFFTFGVQLVLLFSLPLRWWCLRCWSSCSWCWLGQGICYLTECVFCDRTSERAIGNNPYFLNPQGE